MNKEVSKLAKDAVKKYAPFKNVLEIGSAGGIDTFYLAKYTKKITGIDIVIDAIETANIRLKEYNEDIRRKVKFCLGDTEKLKFPDATFDFVYSLSVLHSTDITKSLKEIFRVLTKDGHAIVYILIGKNKLNPFYFLSLIKKYFILENKYEVDVKKEKHKALIVFLRKEK